MKKWTVVSLAGALVVVLASVSGAEEYKRVGGKAFLSYNVPVLSLRENWYNHATRWGGSLVYSVAPNLTMEFEYHRINYRHGKIVDRKFKWGVDKKDYASPNATADMRINSGVVNFMFRLGGKENLFTGQATSPYLVLGAGFHNYTNKVSGLIYPGQSKAPLDPNQFLEPQKDRRATIGANFGFGVERFLSRNFSLDFRVQHNFIVGNLNPRESWGIKEVWPMQMLDLEIALKFYESGK